ncbi:WLM domain containing protein [Ceratobasidium theobromae]|uniref:WLM domain containing protein n=1 Tax=Ceratobasidium theobromae TaxID=1582974 RepID=A0A5N5QS88_9AGAM|nr:WLM domain containing protein [Ceratobasidium theobromae]
MERIDSVADTEANSQTHEILLHVSHGGSVFDATLSADSTLDQLKETLEEITSVPAGRQKLLWKGMKRGAVNLEDSGLKNGSKVTLIGTPEKAIELMHQAEAEASRHAMILRAREASGPTKVWSTPQRTTQGSQFRFHRIEPHSNLPNAIQARSVLSRLSTDPAILKIMHSHKFSVGLLTELAPHEHPNLLGLNINAGQSILLRIRTDAYDGFRTYVEIRRVLCHELAHNVYQGHGDDFKTLNSQLNREVAEYEQSVRAGSRTLSGIDVHGDWASSTRGEAVVQTFVLGGEAPANESREERRRRILKAAISRLEQEEKEIEDRCEG